MAPNRKATFSFLLVLCLAGCGGKEEAPPSEHPPSVDEAPAVAVLATPTLGSIPTETPDPSVINFASLERYPQLEVAVSGDSRPDGDKTCPVADGKTILDASGQPVALYWSAPIPATYEISLPHNAFIDRVEIQTTGGDTALPECVLFVRKEFGGDWEKPRRLRLERRLDGADEDGDRIRYVFRFEDTPALTVRLGFARGSEKQPDRVRVADIDIFGRLVQ